MPPIVRGSIVWAALPGPGGEEILDDSGQPKRRPAVVLSNADDIASGRPLVVAAVSTKFDRQAMPTHWRELPSQPGGHPETGLSEPCVAKPDWLARVRIEDIDAARTSPLPVKSAIIRQMLNWLRDQGNA